MDEEQPEPSSLVPQLDYSWVADEPLYTVSAFVDCEGAPEDLFTEIQTPPTEDCTAWGWRTIPMYQIASSSWAIECPLLTSRRRYFGISV
ncbi:hypothetical protein A2U01_0050506 [Trifolium medium]|uniref:Uncharacterized protein n=1 Tax=Trifolium medium TaxID=97028 RepID=A0A392QZ43_9FABA|nr:hypothetical protein [Trifolium medium]